MQANNGNLFQIKEGEASVEMSGPTVIQLKYLRRGLTEPGGKLPLFDEDGQRFKEQTIKSCLNNGWCTPWYNNPLKPNWLVCKLTESGRDIAEKAE